MELGIKCLLLPSFQTNYRKNCLLHFAASWDVKYLGNTFSKAVSRFKLWVWVALELSGKLLKSDECSLVEAKPEGRPPQGCLWLWWTSSGKPECFNAPLNCLYSNTYGMGSKQEELDICVWTMISLGLQRHGGIAYLTGILSWMARYFLRGRQQIKVVGLLIM